MKLTQELKDSLTNSIKAFSIIMNVKHINSFTKSFKDIIFKGARWQKESDNEKSLCLSIKEPFQQELLNFIEQYQCRLVEKMITIGYEDLTYNEILTKLIPNIQPPQGFEMIGKIAHFNLSADQLPFKYLIGQVLLDKNKNLLTVCNKTEKLHNVYRTPQLELLAGKDSYDAIVPEGGIKLHLNFEKVYWCTRLYSERERIITLIKELNIKNEKIQILDLFCGIGPFSLRAAKDLQAQCLSNDLNPECFYYLKKNITENKLDNFVQPLNLDAREVVLKIYNKEINFQFNHIYMNLPVLAIDFLDVFKGFTKKTNCINLPYIHVYGFAKGKTNEELIDAFSQRIIRCLPGFNKETIIRFHVLKNVTKLKKMCCLSFQLDKISAESEFELLQGFGGNESDYEDDDKQNFEEPIQENIRKIVKLDENK